MRIIKKEAFTLIEMMVILLIFSILLAAFAPSMTKKIAGNPNQQWNYSKDYKNIYFGSADKQNTMIGTKDSHAKLTINTPQSSHPYSGQHLSLKKHESDIAKFIPFKDSNYYFTLKDNTITSSTSQSDNTAFGSYSLYNNLVSYNTGLGAQALYYAVSGSDNTAIGYKAATNGAGDSANVYIGAQTGDARWQDGYNTTVGTLAMNSTTDANKNVALGAGAMNMQNGSQNVTIGYGSLGNLDHNPDTTIDSDCSNNIAIGFASSEILANSHNNIAIGYASLHNPITASDNVGVGAATLHMGDNFKENTTVGTGGLNKLTNGSQNTGIGSHALLEITSGNYNSTFGAYSTHATTTGNYNSAIGSDALRNNYTGSYNSTIGYHSCTSNAISKHTCIGINTIPPSDTDNSSESIYLGSTNLSAIISSITSISPYSDKRLKNVKEEYKSGLTEIKEITPKFFTYKTDKNKQKKVGVIAQELEKSLPDAVEKDDNGYYTVKQEHITYTLVNAVKELDKFVKNVISSIKALFARIFDLNKKINTLEKDTNSIDADLEKINERLKKLEADD